MPGEEFSQIRGKNWGWARTKKRLIFF